MANCSERVQFLGLNCSIPAILISTILPISVPAMAPTTAPDDPRDQQIHSVVNPGNEGLLSAPPPFPQRATCAHPSPPPV